MADRNEHELDQATTRSIFRAVSEKLVHDLEPDNSQLPTDLQTKLRELRRKEE